jgi:hypothetical protein
VAKLRFAPDGRVKHFEEYWHGRSLGLPEKCVHQFEKAKLAIFTSQNSDLI